MSPLDGDRAHGIGVAASDDMANDNDMIHSQPEKKKPGHEESTKPSVRAPHPAPAPRQSRVDQERADWEGMGQSRYAPKED